MSVSMIEGSVSSTYTANSTSSSNSSSGQVRSYLECLTDEDKAALYAATGGTVSGNDIVGCDAQSASLFYDIAFERHASQKTGSNILSGELTASFIQDLASGKYASSVDYNANDINKLISILNSGTSSGNSSLNVTV